MARSWTRRPSTNTKEKEEQMTQQLEAVSLFEVIADHPTSRAGAFGMTFTEEKTAAEYTRRMNAAGYNAEVSPEFLTEATLEAALESAQAHFRDPRITQAK
jgi:hypothetical protein